jgi:hypothetical protein
MIESFRDLPIKDCKNVEELDKILQEYLELSLSSCTQFLAEALVKRASEVASDMVNLAPHGKYDLLMEDKKVMAKFLQEEAMKPENWTPQFIEYKEGSKLMEMIFFNSAVDDGDSLKGFVYIGVSGKIRHAFCQAG